MKPAALLLPLLLALAAPHAAMAWGDEGHRIVALIAARLLEPAVRDKVTTMLAADPDTLTAHDIASEATWADRYRDADRDGSRQHYQQTRQWHFVDIEIGAPDLNAACFGRPSLPPNVLASEGPAKACVVDKIDQFAAELAAPATLPAERLLALKFLLHFVGDLHQPLHAADDHDTGGNQKRVAAEGFATGTLHRYWDVEFVEQLGRDPEKVSDALASKITPEQRAAWAQGAAGDWAMEAFGMARSDAYQLPPMGSDGVYHLPPSYVAAAAADARTQISKAGVRLAVILNKALAGQAGAQPPAASAPAAAPDPSAATQLTPEDAAKHFGQSATVCGTVASAHYVPNAKGRPTFLNLDKAYPGHIFTALIFGEDRNKFGEPERLQGKRVCVTGNIRNYQGKPEIILRDAGQLK